MSNSENPIIGSEEFVYEYHHNLDRQGFPVRSIQIGGGHSILTSRHRPPHIASREPRLCTFLKVQLRATRCLQLRPLPSGIRRTNPSVPF